MSNFTGKLKSFLINLKEKILIRPYYTLRWWNPVWLHIVNHRGKKFLKKHQPRINDVQKRIVHGLSENGIAIANISELFPNDSPLTRLQSLAAELRDRAKPSGKKKFLLELIGPKPRFDFSDPVVRYVLDPRIISAVNAYVGVATRFYLYTLNVTLPVGAEAQEAQSQRWHRDPEDKKFCKVFVYLTDVDENSGPFMYVKGSHYGGKWRSLFPQRPPHGSYPPDGELERMVPADDILVCTAKRGTMIFCDTSGLHKGGFAKSKERIMLTSGYITHASAWNRIFDVMPDFQNKSASLPDPEVRYALTA